MSQDFDRYYDESIDRLRGQVQGWESGPQKSSVFLEDFHNKPDFSGVIGYATWTFGITSVVDTSNSICGLTSLQMQYPVASTGRSTPSQLTCAKVSSNYFPDLSGKSFRFRYYFDTSYAESYTAGLDTSPLYLYLYNSSTKDTNYHIYLPYGSGWNTVEWPFSAMATSATPTTTSMNSFVSFMEPYSNITSNQNITYDMLEIWDNESTKGGFIMTFDDGYAGSYLYAIRYMAKYGLPCMFYISQERIGTTDFCTWDQIYKAADAGAMICTHAQYGTPNDSIQSQRAYYRKQKQALIDHGFVKGAEYWAIPAGQLAWQSVSAGYPALVSMQDCYKTAREFFTHIRGTNPFWQNPKWYPGNSCLLSRHPRDRRWGHGLSMNMSSVSQNTNWIDVACSSKDVLVFFTHNMDTTNTSTTKMRCNVFESSIDYAMGKVAEGLLEFITFEDILLGR